MTITRKIIFYFHKEFAWLAFSYAKSQRISTTSRMFFIVLADVLASKHTCVFICYSSCYRNMALSYGQQTLDAQLWTRVKSIYELNRARLDKLSWYRENKIISKTLVIVFYQVPVEGTNIVSVIGRNQSMSKTESLKTNNDPNDNYVTWCRYDDGHVLVSPRTLDE